MLAKKSFGTLERLQQGTGDRGQGTVALLKYPEDGKLSKGCRKTNLLGPQAWHLKPGSAIEHYFGGQSDRDMQQG